MLDKEEIYKRLEGLGYTSTDTESDDFTITYLIAKCEQYIRNMCNLKDNESVPDGLHYVWVDLVCGHFLREKRDSGKLTEYNGFEISSEISQVRLGDVFVTNGNWNSSPTHRLNVIIETLLDPKELRSELTCYRKVKW